MNAQRISTHILLSTVLAAGLFTSLNTPQAQAQAKQLQSVVIANTYWHDHCIVGGKQGHRLVSVRKEAAVLTSSSVTAVRNAWGTTFRYKGRTSKGSKAWAYSGAKRKIRGAKCYPGKRLFNSTYRFKSEHLTTFRLWNGSRSHVETLHWYWSKYSGYWTR